jgi:hypothetical protein
MNATVSSRAQKNDTNKHQTVQQILKRSLNCTAVTFIFCELKEDQGPLAYGLCKIRESEVCLHV